MKTWTIPERLQALMRMPWTVSVRSEDGELVAEISELPAVTATGASERELLADLYSATETMLEAMLVHGDPIALPPNTVAPWLAEAPAAEVGRTILQVDADAFNSVRARSNAATQSFRMALA